MRTAGLVIALTAVACSTPDDPSVTLRFTPDPGPGNEQYQCFGFAAELLDGADIAGIALDAPAGSVTLHHVALYASPAAFPDGPVDCEAMPDTAVPMNVWATGGGDLELGPELALVVPPGTVRLIIQAHAIHSGDGDASERTLRLRPRRDALHRAGWLPLRAPTPAIGPLQRAEKTADCIIADELHLVSTWPHMHRIGAEFHGRIRHAGASTPLIDVVPWAFDAQRAYPVDGSLAPGDTIETRCIWQNDTDRTVLPGPRITDEMCGQSLIAWPVEAARCQ